MSRDVEDVVWEERGQEPEQSLGNTVLITLFSQGKSVSHFSHYDDIKGVNS